MSINHWRAALQLLSTHISNSTPSVTAQEWTPWWTNRKMIVLFGHTHSDNSVSATYIDGTAINNWSLLWGKNIVSLPDQEQKNLIKLISHENKPITIISHFPIIEVPKPFFFFLTQDTRNFSISSSFMIKTAIKILMHQ